jgi:ABC-type multidrug transport system fused ATPase/permease subunit
VAGILYLQRMADPMGAVMEWVEQLQRGAASFARVQGVALIAPDRVAALAAVGADWVAALPDGLDTVLRAGGAELDSGQAQQLALARLILADPDTVILDEATSMLDPTSARHTERALAAGGSYAALWRAWHGDD